MRDRMMFGQSLRKYHMRHLHERRLLWAEQRPGPQVSGNADGYTNLQTHTQINTHCSHWHTNTHKMKQTPSHILSISPICQCTHSLINPYGLAQTQRLLTAEWWNWRAPPKQSLASQNYFSSLLSGIGLETTITQLNAQSPDQLFRISSKQTKH